MIDGRVKHGLGGRYGRAPEFNTWCKMRARCDSPKSPDYKNYGARGISVSPAWYDFAKFLDDMGPRPTPEHTIERINNNGNYEAGNCCWATRLEQNQNRRPRAALEYCRRGHPFDSDNTYHRPDGKRGCKTCRSANLTAFYARKKEAAQ